MLCIPQVEEAHGDIVQQGQSEVVDDTWNHFVCFVSRNGRLYELDGRKAAPIDHGPTSGDTFLRDAAAAVKEFMARDPEELRFTIVALARNTGEELE